MSLAVQQCLPGFVDAVRISYIGQDTNLFQIILMQTLPDQPGNKEQVFDKFPYFLIFTNVFIGIPERNGLTKAQRGLWDALPKLARRVKTLTRLAITLILRLRLRPAPSLVKGVTRGRGTSIYGIVGIVRLRIRFIPEPPFVRNLTFTLMGAPSVEDSSIPMSRVLPNTFGLPFILRFVKMAIAARTAEFVASKSVTLDIQEMMSGAALGDTLAQGVFLITIHQAKDLSAQDRNGRSDPYIIMAYAKFSKPLYSTRIILGDLNPVFEETAALLVTTEEVRAEEDLGIMLWNSDKRSADDWISRVQVPVKESMSKPNKVIRRTDKLVGFEDATVMSGTLHWSIGRSPKVPLNKALERRPDELPELKRTVTGAEMPPGDKAPMPAKCDLPPPPVDFSRTSPNPDPPDQ
ncbi:hypothetical protein FRC12_020171 [Ceratobasidium sp. 428]|nr:hypothetical protein FRC12_020171 [Ceratobasidium sp. 428]